MAEQVAAFEKKPRSSPRLAAAAAASQQLTSPQVGLHQLCLCACSNHVAASHAAWQLQLVCRSYSLLACSLLKAWTGGCASLRQHDDDDDDDDDVMFFHSRLMALTCRAHTWPRCSVNAPAASSPTMKRRLPSWPKCRTGTGAQLTSALHKLRIPRG